MHLRDETGAEAAEFAIVAPVLLLLVFGIVYALLAAAAHLSLAHAASVAARYASIPLDPVAGVYPDDETACEALGRPCTTAAERIDESTPFFTADDCAASVVGDGVQNAALSLDVTCSFPNPLGSVVSALLGAAPGSGPFADTVAIRATAKARRE